MSAAPTVVSVWEPRGTFGTLKQVCSRCGVTNFSTGPRKHADAEWERFSARHAACEGLSEFVPKGPVEAPKRTEMANAEDAPAGANESGEAFALTNAVPAPPRPSAGQPSGARAAGAPTQAPPICNANCCRPAAANKLLCATHYRMLPQSLQERLARSFVPEALEHVQRGDWMGKRDVLAYVVNALDALCFIARAEQRVDAAHMYARVLANTRKELRRMSSTLPEHPDDRASGQRTWRELTAYEAGSPRHADVRERARLERSESGTSMPVRPPTVAPPRQDGAPLGSGASVHDHMTPRQRAAQAAFAPKGDGDDP